MAEVAVISPNIVEMVGNLQKQFGAPRTERPPVQSQTGDSQQYRSGARAAADTRAIESPLSRSAVGISEDQRRRAAGQAGFQPDRPASRPSTLFLAQLIAQQSPNRSSASARLDAGIAAYQRAGSGPARSPGGYVFLTRHVDTTV